MATQQKSDWRAAVYFMTWRRFGTTPAQQRRKVTSPASGTAITTFRGPKEAGGGGSEGLSTRICSVWGLAPTSKEGAGSRAASRGCQSGSGAAASKRWSTAWVERPTTSGRAKRGEQPPAETASRCGSSGEVCRRRKGRMRKRLELRGLSPD